ncbi:hypothetical protein [Streptomyces sp. I05A-00742]|nr:hypothetical protein [Streptomyces sp. I05A-00742]
MTQPAPLYAAHAIDDRVGPRLGPARDAIVAQELHAEIEAYSPRRLALPR